MAKKELTPKEEIMKEIEKFSALEAMQKSEGGALVLSTLEKDILSTINNICNTYSTASHSEMIASAAKLSERLSVWKILMGATKKKNIALDDLKLFLEENPEG